MASTDPLMTAADGGGTVTLTEHTLTLFDGSVAFYKTARGDESKITCFGQNVLGVSVREASKVSLVIHAFDRAVPGCCGGDTTKRTQKEYEVRARRSRLFFACTYSSPFYFLTPLTSPYK